MVGARIATTTTRAEEGASDETQRGSAERSEGHAEPSAWIL
jgi:hypothetical protein